jgi:hypothetical protein
MQPRTRPTRHPSHKLAASIYCEVEGLPVEIEPLELSTAGLFVETPTPLPVDSEVEVFVRIGETRFEATGHVVQTVSCEQAKAKRRKPGYGLLFTHVSDDARAQLRLGIQLLVSQRAASRPRASTPAKPIPSERARTSGAAGSAKPQSHDVATNKSNTSAKPQPHESGTNRASASAKPQATAGQAARFGVGQTASSPSRAGRDEHPGETADEPAEQDRRARSGELDHAQLASRSGGEAPNRSRRHQRRRPFEHAARADRPTLCRDD